MSTVLGDTVEDKWREQDQNGGRELPMTTLTKGCAPILRFIHRQLILFLNRVALLIMKIEDYGILRRILNRRECLTVHYTDLSLSEMDVRLKSDSLEKTFQRLKSDFKTQVEFSFVSDENKEKKFSSLVEMPAQAQDKNPQSILNIQA